MQFPAKPLIVGLASAFVMSATFATSALASPRVAETARTIDRAVQAAGQTEAVEINPSNVIPTVAQSGVQIQTEAGKNVTLSLPATGDAEQQGMTSVYNGQAIDTNIAVQNLDEGVRALIELTGPNAPERYKFQLGGDVAELALQTDGSVAVVDDSGDQIATVTAPWARDAQGRSVPTRFEIDETTLIQVIDHKSGNFAYPIVADPKFLGKLWRGVKKAIKAAWDFAKCATSLGFAIAPATKIPRAAKIIHDLGGVRATAELMFKAGTKKDFKRWGKKFGNNVGKEILGLAGVEKYCFKR